MLAIATHEPHFEILREDVLVKEASNKGCFLCGETGHMASDCKGKPSIADAAAKTKPVVPETPFVLFHVNVLREYLEMELSFNDPALKWDLVCSHYCPTVLNQERALDDWVFLCFFVGNDFLPHLPSLEIRENAIDRLIKLWKIHTIAQGTYLTSSGDIHLGAVCALMRDLGQVEDEIFANRRRGEERRRDGRRDRRAQARLRKQADEARNAGFAPHLVRHGIPPVHPPPVVQRASDADNRSALEALRAKLKGGGGAAAVVNDASVAVKRTAADMEAADNSVAGDKNDDGDEDDEEEEIEEDSGVSHPTLALNRPLVPDSVIAVKVNPEPQAKPQQKDRMENDSEEEPDDSIRLWESGWKERYYSQKFNTYADDDKFKRAYVFFGSNLCLYSIVTKYVEGLSWVLKYYYQGVPSWTWYYPYHYSPFASDFYFIDELEIKHEIGHPFSPYEQLMGVLPSASRQHVPSCFRPLMTEPTSEIIDFYPEKFPIDLNGKKFAWQGMCIRCCLIGYRCCIAAFY